MSNTSLSDKQIKFCNEYLVDYNATQAAIRAGYSKKTARTQASDLLTKPDIQKFLQSKKERIISKLEISQERTMQEIGRLSFSDIRQYYNEDGSLKKITELSEEAAAALAGVDIEETSIGSEDDVLTRKTKKIKLWDKSKGLEMLAKHFKIYSDAPVTNNVMKFGYGEEKPV